MVDSPAIARERGDCAIHGGISCAIRRFRPRANQDDVFGNSQYLSRHGVGSGKPSTEEVRDTRSESEMARCDKFTATKWPTGASERQGSPVRCRVSPKDVPDGSGQDDASPE